MGNQINWMTCSVSHCRDVEEAKAAVCLDGIRQKQKLQHVLFCVRLKFTRGVSTGTLLVCSSRRASGWIEGRVGLNLALDCAVVAQLRWRAMANCDSSQRREGRGLWVGRLG